MCGRSVAMSISRTSASFHVTRPAVGVNIPVSSLTSVVFPEPFSPTNATTSPAPIETDTSSSTSPSAPGERTGGAAAGRRVHRGNGADERLEVAHEQARLEQPADPGERLLDPRAE